MVTLKCGLEITEWYHSKAWVRFPIRFGFHSTYDAILYRLRDITTYLLKIAKFLYPVFSAPEGGDQAQFREDV